jgi:holo-[acyl-carrier protein] synthase
MNSTGDSGKSLPGIGIDLVDLDSFRVVCHSPDLLKKIFTEGERSYCDSKRDSFSSYAARFAAKEAFFKALSDPELKAVPWRQIETVMEDGVLRLNLSGKLQHRLKNRQVYLSLTHSNYAAAAVVLLLPGE